MLKQNSVQKDPFPLNLELYYLSCVMTEGTDLNQLICRWKIQRNGKRAQEWRQAGGIVALKMVLYCMCSLDVLGRVEFHFCFPVDRLN